jgi:hypothetical protein
LASVSLLDLLTCCAVHVIQVNASEFRAIVLREWLVLTNERVAFGAHYSHRHQSISLWTESLGLNLPAREFGVRCCSTFVQAL